MVRFPWTPPPPPPPPSTPESQSILDVSVILLLVFIVSVSFVIVAFYIKRQWPVWFEECCKKAFQAADKDGSGSLTRDELYTGVLELYLTMHLYGVPAKAPTRQKVMNIMDDIDVDNSGTLDYSEFKRILQVLSELILQRALTQFSLTLVCPFLASYIVLALKWACADVMYYASLSAPATLTNLTKMLPGTLDETIVTTIMMLSVRPALNLVDKRAEASAEAVKRKSIKVA